MLLAIYSKYKSKGEWCLHSFAISAEDAKKQCKSITELAKKIGWEQPETVIQAVPNAYDAPKFLNKLQSEKLIYN
jgi:hypothetical protein